MTKSPREAREYVAPEFLSRHFRQLIQQAILYLGKAEVQRIVDEAEVGG
jgi:hypothetical protein